MDDRFQRRIQRYGWDKAAALYEGYWSRQLKPSQDRLLALAALEPGERMVDIACGTGLVTFPAALAVGPRGKVVGTDISEKMVEVASAEAVRRNLAHAEFRRAEAEALPLPEASVDAALCSLGLMYVPDPGAALREMRRVLRPGGRAVASVWGARDRCGWAEIFPIVDARVHSDVCPLFFRHGTGDLLGGIFEEAGFRDVRSERLTTVLEYDSAEDACGAAFAGGPVALAYSRFDEKTRQGAHAEYVASIEPFRNGKGYAIPGEFVIAVGRR